MVIDMRVFRVLIIIVLVFLSGCSGGSDEIERPMHVCEDRESFLLYKYNESLKYETEYGNDFLYDGEYFYFNDLNDGDVWRYYEPSEDMLEETLEVSSIDELKGNLNCSVKELDESIFELSEESTVYSDFE